jgi:hypothetical protein
VGAQIDEMRTSHGTLSGNPAAMLALVGLPSDAALRKRSPHQQSGGQQQRVCIAMALACDPDLVVPDGTTTGLDATTQARIVTLLADLRVAAQSNQFELFYQPKVDMRSGRVIGLEALLRWTLSQRLSGSVPHLPSTSPALQTSLMSNREYMDSLMTLSDEIGEMIQRARAEGAIRASLRDEFVLYTLYARTCDPTLEFLKAGGAMSDAEIVEQMVSACFRGMAA